MISRNSKQIIFHSYLEKRGQLNRKMQLNNKALYVLSSLVSFNLMIKSPTFKTFFCMKYKYAYYNIICIIQKYNIKTIIMLVCNYYEQFYVAIVKTLCYDLL
jgi:hypothetical protein